MAYLIQRAEAQHIPKIVEITNLEAERSAATVASSSEPVDRWLEQYQQTHNMNPWLVAILKNDESEQDQEAQKIVGYAKAAPYNLRDGFSWSVTLSIYIAHNYKRQGLGDHLYGAMFEILRKQGYLNVYARIALPNPGSQRLHERYGLKQTGILPRFAWKFGQWHDMAIYTGSLQKDIQNPLPLLSVDDVWDDVFKSFSHRS